MKVLIVGGGGREHALGWKVAQSPKQPELYFAPGNGGTRELGLNIPIPDTDIEGLAQFARQAGVDLTIVGPDDPLAMGIVDAFRRQGLRVFGPTRAAAEIEASKVFAKNVMRDANIPTAGYKVYRSYPSALRYVRTLPLPIVIKASGLARGKGVYVCTTLQEAEQALHAIMVGKVHGEAGKQVIIERFLTGEEVSAHALSDGRSFTMFPPSQDHKQLGDGDIGPNTGGMGAFAPVPWVTTEMMLSVSHTIVRPVLDALKFMQRPFTGCLYPGLMFTPTGFKVLEFNSRFGDPETQVYMRLLGSDLLELIEACVDGTLSNFRVKWLPGYAVCVVLASGGYPDSYQKGKLITGIRSAEMVSGVQVFHAGTSHDGLLYTSGGRVLGVTAVGSTLDEALSRAYEAVDLIRFEGMVYRGDIGRKGGPRF